MTDKKWEVLAPVGSYESLIAAVRSGADAVYFGVKDFSARRNAENFSFEELESGVKYCKRNNVKTYLTLNIAIKQKELLSAFETAKRAYISGIDGFIVSDLGLAKMIHGALPDAELHASTQMSVNSPSALKFLKETGFCRVVPAREMNKNELKDLCDEAKKLNMDVEVFVHGALCMSLSGQCLMSSVLGGRSGNRGLCAGTCRLPFSVKGGTGYDLSLKDLSLFDNLYELIEMGVKSFKIEGRMKRPEYVAAATRACQDMATYGKIDQKLKDTLLSVFSRSGFTNGYYTGKLGREMFGVRSADDMEKSKETYSYLHSIYRNEPSNIPLDIYAEILKDKPILLELTSGDKTVKLTAQTPKIAENKPITKQTAENLLKKLGGTPFFLRSININLDDGLFVSASELNEIRRSACEKLCGLFEEIKERKINEINTEVKDGVHNGQKLYAKFLSTEQIPSSLDGVSLIIIPLEKVGDMGEITTEIAVDIPRFTSNEQSISTLLDKAKQKGIKKAVCGTVGAIEIAKKEGFQIIGDIGLNVLNELSAETLKENGVSEIMLSCEIDINSAKNFKTTLKKGIFAYGRLPLMCMKNCPVKNGRTCEKCDKKAVIKDRKSIEFPIRCRNGFSELYNSKPVFSADKLNELKVLDILLLSFTTEEKAECEKIINGYTVGANAPDDFTRGLYFRELI